MAQQKKKYARRVTRTRVLQVALFFIVFFLMSLVSLMIPLRPQRSEMEGRELADFPSFSFGALFSGEFFDDINTWFADTFPGRDGWMGLSESVKDRYGVSSGKMEVHGDVVEGDDIPDVTYTTTAPQTTRPTAKAPVIGQTQTTVTTTPPVSGETTPQVTQPSTQGGKPAGQDKDASSQSFGAILTVGDSGFEYYNFVQRVADDYVAVVNEAAASLDGVAKVYDMIVPTSMDICLDASRREGLNTSNQRDAIRYMYAAMNENVTAIDVYTALEASHQNGEYCYFRTDHHWTAWGAYRAYEQMCFAMDKEPTLPDAFGITEYDGYLGSFYRETQLSAMKQNPDVVQAFIPPSTNTMQVTWTDGSTTEYPIVTDVTDWSELYKYNTFIGGDNPLAVIENPNITDGSACILVKESFGNAFAPFLVEDYQTVYIIDYRYFSKVYDSSLASFATEHGATDVIFLNNVSATRNADLVSKMDGLVG